MEDPQFEFQQRKKIECTGMFTHLMTKIVIYEEFRYHLKVKGVHQNVKQVIRQNKEESREKSSFSNEQTRNAFKTRK